MTRRRNGSTRRGRAQNARILAASDVCHICGQSGADAVDHVVALARGGADTLDNKRPAHHDVPPFCNRVKGAKAWAPIVKRSGALD
jgi:5-methylcytosine-specific restriction endonuclease McrA